MSKPQSSVNRRRQALKKDQQRGRIQQRLLGIGVLLLLVVGAVFVLVDNEASAPSAESPATEALATAPEVGALAPDFQLVSNSGEVMTLSQYRGQPVAVMFMHTW